MKSFFKQSAISMIILGGIAGSAHAMHANHHAQGGPFFAPTSHGFFVGLEALRLRPENGDLDVSITFNTAGEEGTIFTQSIKPEYHWDWRLFAGVNLGDNDDFTISWFRMRSSNSDSADFTNVADFDTRFDVLGDLLDSHVDFHVDNFYAVMGHTVYFNNPWSIRFAAGVEYAKVKSDLTVEGSRTNGDFEVTSSNSELKGWGPRGEFDINYRLMDNFALFANSSATLLSSKRKVSASDTGFDEGEDFSDEDDWSTRHVVVPKFGTRLGVSYTFGWGQAGAEGGSMVTIYGGWQVESYIHAIERLNFEGDVQDSTRTSNFGDQGLFLGVKFNSGWM